MRTTFEMPELYKFIKMANDEFFYNNKTRTEKYIAMENKIFMSKKPYYYINFARYAQGADIEKFKEEILKIGNVEECFYFLQFVIGADLNKYKKDVKKYGKAFVIENTLMPFFSKAIQSSNSNWIIAYLQYSEERGLLSYDEAEELVHTFNQEYNFDINYRKQKLDFERTMNASLKEYKQNGVTENYVENENRILCSNLANMLMYIERAPKANLSKFANNFAKHGDLFFILVFVRKYYKYLTEQQKSRLIVAASLSLLDKSLYKYMNKTKIREIRRLIAKETDEKKLKELKEILAQLSIPDAVYNARNDFRAVLGYIYGDVDILGL